MSTDLGTLLKNDSAKPLNGKIVWHGRNLVDHTQWCYKLSTAEVIELLNAVDNSKNPGNCISKLNINDFSFNHLAQSLNQIRKQVLEGIGFAVIKGLPAEEWDKETLIRAYWIIGKWMGDAVSQNGSGDLLGHIIDQRFEPTDTVTRIYQTNRAQPFHSDSCDIVGLLCLNQAKQGGRSALASSAAIFNHLLASNPSALKILCGEFNCDRYDEIPTGKLPYYSVRIFSHVDGNFVCCGMDPDIRSAQRLKDVGPLRPDQINALDAFQSSAKAHALSMMLEPGDIQLVNNLTVVHAREEFEDYLDPDQRRYMIRLWLSHSHKRPLPEFLKERWGNIDVGSIRGGIKVPGVTPQIRLKAM